MGGALVFTIAVLIRSGGSLSDPDVWWHVRTGRLIIDSGSVPHTDPWSFTADRNSWIPTAWLSDVLFAGVWFWGSWDAIRLLRIVLAVGVVAALWWVARRDAALTPAAALATALVLLAVAPFLRERPQVLSFIFVAWLAVQADSIMQGRMPRLLLCVPICWLWANLHGMWVLMPAVLLFVGVFAWLDDRSRVDLAARCTSAAFACWAVTLFTPVGPRLAIWPLVVRDVAAPITEWQPTLPLTTVGFPLTVILAVIVWSWTREQGVQLGQLAYGATVFTFGLLAFRNVPPAAILLLPLLVRALTVLLRHPRWRHPVRPRAAGLLYIMVVVLGVSGAGWRASAVPTFAAEEPLRIVDELKSRPGEIRVLNSYNVGGLLTGLASPPVRVAIDGRTDIWSAEFVETYIDDVSGRGDWRGLVDRLRPDAAVLPIRSEVARGLQIERGWRTTITDGDWQLLEPRHRLIGSPELS